VFEAFFVVHGFTPFQHPVTVLLFKTVHKLNKPSPHFASAFWAFHLITRPNTNDLNVILLHAHYMTPAFSMHTDQHFINCTHF